jgi:signal transduction histidine kinase/DNA-binding response OmpR family regulator/HPt (histidine-containing phosphotransfer) domain-containing protein
MFSIRSRVFFVITSIVIVITLSTLGLSLLVSRSRFEATVESDLTTISKIAEAVIANEIRLIKEQAYSTAALIEEAKVEDIPAILDREFEWYRYQNLVVIDRNGVLASYREIVQPDEYFKTNEYAKRAFQGESVISTTEYSLEGELIFRTWVPAGPDRVLVISLSGLNFSNIIKDFRIWQTGHIYVLDAEGTVIAYFRPEMVLGQRNFIESAKTDPRWRSAGEFFTAMIQGGSGMGRYSFGGIDRLCAYTQITGSDGWVLGAVAPSGESPLSKINQVLLISAAAFLVLGLFSASFASKSIATPYEQVKEQNIRLEELKQAAENMSETKTHFLANMSHEMRTPLNAIIGLAELGLGSDELSGNAYDNMEKIYVSGMTLLGIINDILDISKIESGKFVLAPSEYEAPSLVNDTIIQNIIRIGSKPIQFKLHVEEDMPFKLIGDELRVKQIFNNLLSNAFKYTEKGTVDWYLSSEVNGDSVWFISSIKDTGIGIRQEDIPKLFTDYNQVDIRSSRRIEGTGLGLSITKNLVELMDGTITLESEYGKGSTFSIRIRQQYVDDSVIGKEIADNLSNFRYTVDRRYKNEKLVRAWLPYATVLVVDDVPTNLDVAKGMLKPYGMTVDCVETGQRAIDLVREAKIKYNAIFMDHMMPEMDGFEAVQIIRNEIGTDYARTVPVVALTANAILGSEDLFLKNGFQAFLSKPIDIIRLDMIVNRYVRNKKLEENLGLTGKKPDSPGDQGGGAAKKQSRFAGTFLDGIDFNAGLKRFENNEETYLGIIASYLSQSQDLIEKVRLISLEAWSSPTAKPMQDYKIAIHSLKSTSYTIGAWQIGSMAEELEKAVLAEDMNFVNARNGALLKALEKFIPSLKNFFDKIQNANQKPVRQAPDPALLTKILEASANYDMEQLDSAMDELEQYRYETQADLIKWLRKQIDKSELENIKERLSSLNIKGDSKNG